MTATERNVGNTELEKTRFCFWESLIKCAENTRHSKIAPGYRHWLQVGAGISGMAFAYVITKKYCSVELYIGRTNGEENYRFFGKLIENKGAVEKVCGHQLKWQRLDGHNGERSRNACRIVYVIPNAANFQNRKSEWPKIQADMIDAMTRLEIALSDSLEALRKKVIV